MARAGSTPTNISSRRREGKGQDPPSSCPSFYISLFLSSGWSTDVPWPDATASTTTMSSSSSASASASPPVSLRCALPARGVASPASSTLGKTHSTFNAVPAGPGARPPELCTAHRGRRMTRDRKCDMCLDLSVVSLQARNMYLFLGRAK
eukprot:CAMPEP_0197459360 /NCGR_PEP_ID=MMETSP1175-20131217/51206_1 /TAXON_ID=1003142 /ORGANISM="Triceratium dubium, Strain CCMP147" /LENGTH=149 /DNA_ID=CAMNT_0042994215 /DNA_START=677 /DNA_END=1123 /DNA_ORIENTATION=+